MSISENPTKYIGRSIRLKRLSKEVQVFLYSLGEDGSFEGTWRTEDGELITGSISFNEVEATLK